MTSCCCRCLCKETTKDRMFKRGFNKFLKEIEITNLLKTVRILKTLAKKNFSKIQWRIYKLQHGARKLHIDQSYDKLVDNKIFKTHVVNPVKRKSVVVQEEPALTDLGVDQEERQVDNSFSNNVIDDYYNSAIDNLHTHQQLANEKGRQDDS